MKKTWYLLLFTLMLSATTKAQTNWVTKNIDDKFSIKFPAEPVKTTKPTGDVYFYKAADSLAYSAAMLNMSVIAHLDSAALAPLKDNQQFADQVMAGMASSKKNYTFGKVTIGKWKTYTEYTISGSDNTNKNSLLMQMIIKGSKMYILSCRVPAGMDTKTNEVFFGSAAMK